MALPAVLPSVTCHGVGTLIAIISQLNTLPACAPVNASMAALRLATHDSGSGWFATPFLYDSLIHYSTPVLSRRTTRAARDLRRRQAAVFLIPLAVMFLVAHEFQHIIGGHLDWLEAWSGEMSISEVLGIRRDPKNG